MSFLNNDSDYSSEDQENIEDFQDQLSKYTLVFTNFQSNWMRRQIGLAWTMTLRVLAELALMVQLASSKMSSLTISTNSRHTLALTVVCTIPQLSSNVCTPIATSGFATVKG